MRAMRDARARVLRSPHRSTFCDARTSSPSTDAEVNKLLALSVGGRHAAALGQPPQPPGRLTTTVTHTQRSHQQSNIQTVCGTWVSDARRRRQQSVSRPLGRSLSLAR